MLVVLLIGVSYSIYNYTFTGNKNVIETDGVELELLESNENIIEISNALPITDEKGMMQEETFDFAVTSRTKRDMDIPYNLYIEKLGVLCSSIINHSQENNPDCYDVSITDEGKNVLIDFIATINEIDKNSATEYYEALESKDDVHMKEILILAGVPEEDVENLVEWDKNAGYLAGYIDWYESDTGKEANKSYEFNGNNIDYSNSLSDSQIKIYLTDYEGNKILGPIKVSELSEYTLYNGIHEHNKENGEIKDKFKLRAWIDYDVDVSNWTEDTNLEYRFRIGVRTIEKLENTSNEVYSWSTKVVFLGDSLNSISEYTTDYNTLGFNHFLKHNIGSDNTVDSNEVCYILNETLYCLKGGYSDYFEENKNILLASFGEANCSVDSSYVDCSLSGLYTGASDDGSVYAGNCFSDYRGANCGK